MLVLALVWRSRSSSTGVSPPFGIGRSSLKEASNLATACCRFYSRFSLSLQSVHYLHMCRPQFSAKKQWPSAFSCCTGSRSLKFTQACFQRTTSSPKHACLRNCHTFYKVSAVQASCSDSNTIVTLTETLLCLSGGRQTELYRARGCAAAAPGSHAPLSQRKKQLRSFLAVIERG